jgi:1-acyl-sn-glycerol-3-phosphate acyltransferase
VAGDRGVDLIREAAQQVAAGKSLLIFPEGTRTRPGEILNPLKHGFALIAQRAHAPVQIIRVKGSPGMGRKGHAWWRLPELPGRFEFSLDALIPADEFNTPLMLTEHVATRLRA